jgi:hypothetical protein
MIDVTRTARAAAWLQGLRAEAFVEGLKARGIAPHVAINGTGERAWQDAQGRCHVIEATT